MTAVLWSLKLDAAAWRSRITSSNIGKDKSFVDDLNMERGIVRVRVAFVPRSAEIKPLFWRFVHYISLF